MGKTSFIKYIILTLAILVFAQILFYNKGLTDTINQANQAKAIQESEFAQLRAEKEKLTAELRRHEAELPGLISSLPDFMLKGYQDPEGRTVALIDHLESSLAPESGIAYVISKNYALKNEPIPVYEGDLSFSFSFTQLYEAEGFFKTINQNMQHYPFLVRGIELKRDGGFKTNGTIRAAYVIPAAQDLKVLSGRVSGS